MLKHPGMALPGRQRGSGGARDDGASGPAAPFVMSLHFVCYSVELRTAGPEFLFWWEGKREAAAIWVEKNRGRGLGM